MKMIVRNFFAEFRILQLLPETFRGWIKFWSTQFTKWNQHSQSVAQVCCNQNVFKKLYFSKFLILQFFQISWLLKLYVKILKQQRFYERMQPPLSSRKGIFLRSFTFYNFCQNFSFQFLEGNCVTLKVLKISHDCNKEVSTKKYKSQISSKNVNFAKLAVYNFSQNLGFRQLEEDW